MWKTSLLLFILAILTGGMSFIGWGNIFPERTLHVLLISAIIIAVYLIKRPLDQRSEIWQFAYLFAFIPFISVLGANLYHNQPVILTFFTTFKNLGYYLFFLLCAIRMKEREVIKVIFIYAYIWTFMEVVQQFTYPTYWFATRFDDEISAIEIRNGIYRFAIIGHQLCLIMMFYCFGKAAIENHTKYYLGLFVGIVGIYLTTTRQVIGVSFFAMAIVFLFAKKYKYTNMLAVFLIVFVLSLNYSTLFGFFVDKTMEIDEDYIRFITYRFYGLQYNDGDLLRSILGNGAFDSSTEYGREILSHREEGLYLSDIGYVGTYATYGFVYVILIVVFYIYAFRNYKYLNYYLKMYLIYILLTGVMHWSFGKDPSSVGISAIAFYLLHLSIVQNKYLEEASRRAGFPY